MTGNDLSLLVALIGAACLSGGWFGRKTVDLRDTLMLIAVGGGKVALAIGLWVFAGQG